MLKPAIRRTIQKTGYDIVRYNGSSSLARRRLLLMRDRDIDLVLDVGANEGQYARLLRRQGYRQRIISFEPLPKAYSRLSRAARRDSEWECYEYAIGASHSTAMLNIAGNSVSSSLLPMLRRHIDAAPSSRYSEEVEVEVRPLDSFMERLRPSSNHVYLKVDVQGYESQVLEGSRELLELVALLELELSLVPLYQGQMLFQEMVEVLRQHGYELVSLDPVFADPLTGHLLQMDGIFERKASTGVAS